MTDIWVGAATLHEAMGRRGVVPPRLKPVDPTFRISGPAFPVLCAQGSNLALHQALYAAAPGDVLVVAVERAGSVEFGYFGEPFGRPHGETLPGWGEDEPNADMWATAGESRADVLAFYRRACAHADSTIDALPLDTVGTVPWWDEGRRETTLERIVVHLIDETSRHAGHADIVRELIDGTAGLTAGNPNLPGAGAQWWTAYVDRLEQAARTAPD